MQFYDSWDVAAGGAVSTVEVLYSTAASAIDNIIITLYEDGREKQQSI